MPCLRRAVILAVALPLVIAIGVVAMASFIGCDAPSAAATKTASFVPQADGASRTAESDVPKILLDLEKSEIKLGFIKLTDCVPLVIAKEQGFFAEEGLNVRLESQPNWKTLLDRVISGELDGAHMLSGQPLAATIGIGAKAKIVTGFTLDRNGNAITVSQTLWKEMQKSDPALDSPTPPHPISADGLKNAVETRKASGDPLRFATVFPVSTHNYQLRYWLAASGIHPGMYGPNDLIGETGADVLLSVTPPPQMPSTLEQGTIQGYCVGEPWNQQAVAKGIGVPVVTSYDIWKDNPEKVFGVTAEWNDAHPNAHVAIVKALIRAGQWLDAKDAEGRFLHREEASRLLSQSDYVGADYQTIANSMTGTFVFQKTDRRSLPEFNVFFDGHATYPYYSDGVWFLTQMRRWGQIGEAKPESWYFDTAKEVYRPDVYLKAATLLVAEGLLDETDIPETDGYRPPTGDFIDGVVYDGTRPLEYLGQHEIGNRD